jgi:nonribosomal peptide synthetase DhbF
MAEPAAGLPGVSPLSLLQEQLWLVGELSADQAAAYNTAAVVRLTGPLDVPALRRGLTSLLERHEVLRAVVEPRDGIACQVAVPAVEPALPVEDRRPPGGRADEAAVLAEIGRDARQHIDLATGPVTRFRLLRLAPEEHLLSMTTHYACCDAAAAEILLAELAALYQAHVAGQPPELPDPPSRYADFAKWQRDWMASGAAGEHLDYWQRQLTGLPTLDLPTDRPRPAQPSYAGELFAHRVPAEAAHTARKLANAEGASLLDVLMAALAVVLARYTGQDDVAVGTANPGRDRPGLENLVGLLANMNVLRFGMSGNPSFGELIGRVARVTAAAREHGDVPFAKVVERLGVARDPSRNPLFQVAMDLRPGARAVESAGLRMELVRAGQGTSRFDVAITAVDEQDQLTLWVEYATDLFDRWRVEGLVRHLVRVLDGGTADPGVRVSQVDLLSPAERRLVLSEWQGERREYRRELVHVMIAEQAARTPEAPAVVFNGQTLTYGELERRAGVVAGLLAERGVAPGDVVAVALERGLEAPVALLGVLKAGAAFVPLEPSHPVERLGWMLDDSAAKAVLTVAGLAGGLPVGERPVVLLDEVDYTAAVPGSVPVVSGGLESAAYVLYTSGSTGRPKGVVIEHHALATYIDFLGNVFGFGPGDRMLQFSSLIFDLSEGELFTGLSRGAAIVLIPREATLSPAALSALMRAERVTYLGAPPAMIALLDPAGYPDLRGMLVGGEAFSGDLVNRWNTPGRLFLNAYGPTEATIGCAYYPCEHKRWTASPPIGRAMPHRRVYLLDRWQNPVPVGVPGEIVAAGEGLARGYLNNPELTASKFTADPFVAGDRMYHTGDLGVWTTGGQIQFLGRADTQIKLRGQRIELEEIETALATHPRVSQAVAALRHDLPGGDAIAAYILPAPGHDAPAPGELREHLATMLPTYMLPVAYVNIGELPLSATGKVNRAALPVPSSADAVQAPYTAPRTASEQLIAAIYADILGNPRIGAHDSFFDLGGNSLQAARVATHVAERTGMELRARDVFTTPVVAGLAARLDQIAQDTAAKKEEADLLAAEVADLERQLEEARQLLAEQDGSQEGHAR